MTKTEAEVGERWSDSGGFADELVVNYESKGGIDIVAKFGLRNWKEVAIY